ncbi:MAG: hypothetical protein H0V56_09420 [Chthoniobacterales bacterium]|nr:hypothetical protein [Chthoniobacterales bacterium]
MPRAVEAANNLFAGDCRFDTISRADVALSQRRQFLAAEPSLRVES